MQIYKSVVDGLPFDLTEAVKEYAVARSIHALTVDQPAPVSHPLVEAIVHGGGHFTVIDDPEPEANLVTALQQQIEEMRARLEALEAPHGN